MRRLYIAGELVNIDDQTAIGIDIQTYDVKEPGKRKIKISNSFSIPVTNNNLKILGFIGGAQTTNKTMYNALYCDYYSNNVQFIATAKVRVQEISQRIEVFVYEKPDIWDTLKKIEWADFVQGYFDWLDIPKSAAEGEPVLQDFLDPYFPAGGSDRIFLPYTVASDGDSDDNLILSSFDRIDAEFDMSGGNFFSFVKDVFEYIEDTYGVNFYTSGTTFPYNIWDDAIAPTMYWHFRDLYIKKDGTLTTDEYYFAVETRDEAYYLTEFTASETRDKSLYDFVISFVQQFNIIIDADAHDNYKLRRFDDIKNAEVVDFSGGITGKPKFIPFVDGYMQSNYIKYKSVEDGLDENSNARILTCLNKNIDEKVDLFSINAFLPRFTNNVINGIGGIDKFVPNISTKDSFKNFKFFVNGDQLTTDVELYVEFTDNGVFVNRLPKADKTGMFAPQLYSLDSEYQTLDEKLDYPVFYEIEKWLTALEIYNFENFKLYWINELSGAYFINKIGGFNPDKSKQATTIELFKINNRTPSELIIEKENWTDGLGVNWTDGLGVIWQTEI